MSASTEIALNESIARAKLARRAATAALEVEREAIIDFIDTARGARWRWSNIGEVLGISDVAAQRYYTRNRKLVRSL